MGMIKQGLFLLLLSVLGACGGGGGGGSNGGGGNTDNGGNNNGNNGGNADVSYWTVQAGSAADDKAIDVGVDADGNIYAVIRTDGGIDGHDNAGSLDIAVVKYNPAGVLQWSAQFGSTVTDTATALTVTSDAVYVTGFTEGDIDGAGSQSSSGNTDIVVAKYLLDGTRDWLMQMGTNGVDEAYDITSDGSDIFIAGMTSGDVNNVGSGIFADGIGDVLVVKVLSNGNIDWLSQVGSSQYDDAKGIAIQGTDIYITGHTFGDFNATNAGGRDGIIAKFASDGSLTWSKQFGTAANEVARRIVADANNIYITGQTRGNLDGNTNTGGTCYNSADGQDETCRDVFVSKYNNAGTLQWTYQTGSDQDDIGYDIILLNGALYIAGRAGGSINGQTLQDTTAMLTMKIDTDGNPVWTRLRGTGSVGVTNVAFGMATDGSDLYSAGSSNGKLDGHVSAGGDDAFIIKRGTDGGLL